MAIFGAMMKEFLQMYGRVKAETVVIHGMEMEGRMQAMRWVWKRQDSYSSSPQRSYQSINKAFDQLLLPLTCLA